MCAPIHPRNVAFRAIRERLRNVDRAGTFSQNLEKFNQIFKEEVERQRLPYGPDDGNAEVSIYFFPFSAHHPQWQQSIDIVESSRQFTVFDRFGRFAMYKKDKTRFGELLESNSKGDPIAALEGRTAINLLENFARLSKDSDEQKIMITKLEEKISILEDNDVRQASISRIFYRLVGRIVGRR